MFCLKCGKELPDDSQFCSKCGQSLAAPHSSPASKPKSGKNIPRLIVGIIVGLLLAFAIVWFGNHANTEAGASNSSALQRAFAQPRAMIITNQAITVQALGSSYYKFIVPPGSTNVSVDGHFSATGGLGNDIIVDVFGEDQFVNFENGHPMQTFYTSGKVTQD